MTSNRSGFSQKIGTGFSDPDDPFATIALLQRQLEELSTRQEHLCTRHENQLAELSSRHEHELTELKAELADSLATQLARISALEARFCEGRWGAAREEEVAVGSSVSWEPDAKKPCQESSEVRNNAKPPHSPFVKALRQPYRAGSPLRRFVPSEDAELGAASK